MTSWRDTTSGAAQNDLDGLLDVGLELAQQQLAAHGEFYPFGLALAGLSETVEVIAADPTVGEHPESVNVVASCREQFANRREHLRAVAVVADVRLPPERGGDGIRVELEHVQGAALVVVLPYSREGGRGDFTYGQLAASQGDRFAWMA